MRIFVSLMLVTACTSDAIVVETNDELVPEVVAPTPEPEREVEVAPEPTPPTEAELRAQREAHEQAVAAARAEAARAAFEARFPNHGMTFHFLARVRSRPHSDAPVLGYMRRGARFRASERVPGVGCRRGWFEVPGDGFVCRGEGFLIDDEPPSFEPVPVAAALEDALPYAYAYTARADVPQYWRVPSLAEESKAREVLETLATAEAAAAAAETAAAETAAAETAAAETAAAEAATVVAETRPTDVATPAIDAGAPDVGAAVASAAVEEAAVEAEAHAVEAEAPPPPGEENETGAEEVDPSLVAAARGQVEIPDFVRLRMARGFYVSLDGIVTDQGRRFYRTIRGAFIRAEHVLENEPPTHRGVVLGQQWQLPVAFVFRTGARRVRRAANGTFRNDGTIARHTAYPVGDSMRRGRHEYTVARGGYATRRSAVRIAVPTERPTEIASGDRWIHVDLSEQTLVAYEDETPVFATTVSTGREGFETPTGLFRVQSKHTSTTMDDLNAGEESYLIEDVPWTMYFENSYALHAAFWHHSFGRVRSHGCVNLAPADARWIFQWSTPTLPAAWHGMFADDRHVGTWIYITE